MDQGETHFPQACDRTKFSGSGCPAGGVCETSNSQERVRLQGGQVKTLAQAGVCRGWTQNCAAGRLGQGGYSQVVLVRDPVEGGFAAMKVSVRHGVACVGAPHPNYHSRPGSRLQPLGDRPDQLNHVTL